MFVALVAPATATPDWSKGQKSSSEQSMQSVDNLSDKKLHSSVRGSELIDQFRYIKIQPKTIDFSTRLLGINPTNSVFIPTSLVLRSIVLG